MGIMARVTLCMILLMMLVLPVQAQDSSVGSFRTELLRQLAQSLHLTSDSLPDGFSCKTVDGNCISIIKEDNVITHLGYHMFSEESHSSNRSDVLSFIERIFLYLMYPGERTQAWILRDYLLPWALCPVALLVLLYHRFFSGGWRQGIAMLIAQNFGK